MTNDDITPSAMPGALALPLLQEISGWQNTTTIILHGGSVFEFKGVFPSGEVANGFYNLSGANGFEGHLNLAKIDHIAFQSKKHRGQESHAFVFNNKASDCIFKIFVGRDADGTLHESQKQHYLAYQQKYLSGVLA